MMNRIESPAALKAAQAKYQAALAAETRRVLICTGTGCLASGGLKIYEALQRKLNAMGIPCEVQLDGEHEGETVGVRKTGCHGLCEFGPMLRIEPENWVQRGLLSQEFSGKRGGGLSPVRHRLFRGGEGQVCPESAEWRGHFQWSAHAKAKALPASAQNGAVADRA